MIHSENSYSREKIEYLEYQHSKVTIIHTKKPEILKMKYFLSVFPGNSKCSRYAFYNEYNVYILKIFIACMQQTPLTRRLSHIP